MAPATADGHVRAIQWWIPTLAGVVASAVVAAAIVVLELGPFAPGPELPPADSVAAS